MHSVNLRLPNGHNVLLRPQQHQALEAVLAGLRKNKSQQLVVLPTGIGKTVFAAVLASYFPRVLFMVHRRELFFQSISTFRATSHQQIGLVWKRYNQWQQPLVIGMIPTMLKRLEHYPKDAFDLVCVDECHHAGSASWLEVISHFVPKLRLGLTATPERYDGVPLSSIFGEIIHETTVLEAIQSGYLVRPKALTVRTHISLDSVKKCGLEFDETELERALNTKARNQLAVDVFLRHAKNRKTIVFTVNIAHAIALCEEMVAAGVNAVWVHGDDPDRDVKVKAYKNGEYQVIINAQLLTEGFDDTETSCVMLLRPTRSRVSMVQMIGRALRIHPGKTDAIILALIDDSSVRLMVPWNFLGEDLLPVDNLEEPVDLLQLLEEEDHRNDDEKEQEDELMQERFERLFNAPINLKSSVEVLNLFKNPPEKPPQQVMGERLWHTTPATEKQLALLQQHGYDTQGEAWTKGAAAQTINNLPATDKQLKLLLGYGWNVLTFDWTRGQAAEALNSCAGLEPEWSKVQGLKNEGARMSAFLRGF
jgi:superfamily II DNA or RNA helicase